MPGELGNEEMQQGVGYYENRYPPDLKPNEDTMEEMRKRISNKSLLRVMRDYGEDKEK
jgi:hypothetical protein